MQEELTAPGPTGSAQASFPTLARIAVAGVFFDLAANGQMPGIWTPLFLVGVAALFADELLGSSEARMLAATGLLFAAFLAVRADPFLMLANGGVALGAFALAAIPDARTIFRAPLLSYVQKAWPLGMAGLRSPAFVVLPLARALAPIRYRRLRSALRLAAIVVPILLIFAALLASADRVFGDLVTPAFPHWRFASIISHVFFILLGVGGAATLARASRGPTPSGDPVLRTRAGLGASEWISVLAGIDLLFALFVGIQFAVLFGGSHRVTVTPGLTYASYARTGFFQLIVVAGLAVLVILGAWDLGVRSGARERRWFRALTTIMVALCGVILASAWKRLGLYEGAFGFTLARFAATVAIVWVAMVIAVVLVALWRGARDRVTAAVLIGSLVTLLAINIVSPDRFIAQHNLARFDRIGKIDVGYLGTALSADAVPNLISALPRLSGGDALELKLELCARYDLLAGPTDPRSWNAGRSAARAALRRARINGDACKTWLAPRAKPAGP